MSILLCLLVSASALKLQQEPELSLEPGEVSLSKPRGPDWRSASCLPSDGKLPSFSSRAELKTNVSWHSYLEDLYGSSINDDKFYPLDISKFLMLHEDKLAAFQIHFKDPKLPTATCPLHRHQLYECLSTFKCEWDLKNAVYIHQCADKEGYFGVEAVQLPSHSRVEVTHCNAETEANGMGTWMYRMPGSGMFYNLGVTRAYEGHSDAVRDLLGENCATAPSDRNGPQCREHLARLMEEARRQKIDSIQITKHNDMKCGPTAIEIIDVNSSGNESLQAEMLEKRVQVRCGLGGDLPCTCQDVKNVVGNVCAHCQAAKF